MKSRVLAAVVFVATAGIVIAGGWLTAAPASARTEPPPLGLPPVTVPPVVLPPVVVPPIHVPLPIPGVPALSLPGVTIAAGEVAVIVPPVDLDVPVTPAAPTAPSAPPAPVPASPASAANAERAAVPAPAVPADASPGSPPPTTPVDDDDVNARPLSQAVADTTRSSVPLLAMAVILALFVVVHARSGRDDPKLAVAPVDNDYLGFG